MSIEDFEIWNCFRQNQERIPQSESVMNNYSMKKESGDLTHISNHTKIHKKFILALFCLQASFSIDEEFSFLIEHHELMDFLPHDSQIVIACFPPKYINEVIDQYKKTESKFFSIC